MRGAGLESDSHAITDFRLSFAWLHARKPAACLAISGSGEFNVILEVRSEIALGSNVGRESRSFGA